MFFFAQKSILDYVIICQKMKRFIEKMKIDDKMLTSKN